MTIVIVLTLQEVPLRYYYYCGLLLQYYCLKHIFLFEEEIKTIKAFKLFLFVLFAIKELNKRFYTESNLCKLLFAFLSVNVTYT